MSKIFYNGIDVFNGVCTTPYVGRSDSMIQAGERWGTVETFTLNGRIFSSTCTGGYNDLLNKQQTLISRLSQDFQTFEIHDNTTIVYSQNYAAVTNVSFGTSVYSTEVSFTIEFTCYPTTFFSSYGILDPVEQVKYEEGKDGVLQIVHTISCKGFNTSNTTSNALTNAQTWVNARTGWNGSKPLPNFIANSGGITPCLQTISENIDRMNGRYEIVETYLADVYLTGLGILRYTTDYSYNIESGITTVSVKGDIRGCKGGTITDCRNRFAAFNTYTIANNQLNKIVSRFDLSPIALVAQVEEQEDKKILGFNFIYNDDPEPKIYVQYTTTFAYDYENDIITASIEAAVRGRGTYENKWTPMTLLASQIDLYSTIVPFFNAYVAANYPSLSSFPLDPIPTSVSENFNQYETTINISSTFTNKPVPPVGLRTWNYSLNFVPSIEKFASGPILDSQGQWFTMDLGYATLAECTIEAEAIGALSTPINNVASIVKAQVLKISNDNFVGTRKFLKNQNIILSNTAFNRSVRASATYVAKQAAIKF